MRFRLGLTMGFAAGYYLGAKAGRGRYEQMQRWINGARDSGLVETASAKAKAAVDLGVERARDVIEQRRANHTTLEPDPAEAMAHAMGGNSDR